MTLFFSRMCAAFPGRLPREILAEMDALPTGFLEEIVEAGAFEQAFHAYHQNPAAATGGLVEYVKQINAAQAQEELEQR